MSEFNTPTSVSMSPYVVSADTAGLLNRWGLDNGLQTPSQAYFEDLSVDLGANLQQATGTTVEVVPENELREGMERLIHTSPYPVVSLDRAYFDNNHPSIVAYIDVTRAVKEVEGEDGQVSHKGVDGLTPRPGFPSLQEQLEALRTSEESPITLLDDVVYSGGGR